MSAAVVTGAQARPRGWWERLMQWTPSDEEVRRIADLAYASLRFLDLCLKAAVVAAVIYFAFEMAAAWFAGGSAARVLGGW